MKYLLWLYPRAWRARYGDELAELLDTERCSLILILDVVRGAIDAHLRPQVPVAGANGLNGGKTIEREISMRQGLLTPCAVGPELRVRDYFIGWGIILGGTVLLSVLWLGMRKLYGHSPAVEAFSLMPAPAAIVLSLPFTFYKASSAATKALIVGGGLALVIVLSMLVGGLSSGL
jgi:hypothetical protein